MLLGRIYNHVVRERQWNIGFPDKSLEALVHGASFSVRMLQHSYTDRWFADPFVLEVTDDEILLLAEDYDIHLRRGRISLLIVERNTLELKTLTPVLDVARHLSFPCIVRKNGKVYIMPENLFGEGLTLYEFDQKTYSCRKEKVVSTQPLADAVLTDVFGEEMLLGTYLPYDNPVLRTFVYNTQGEEVRHESYVFANKTARNAGAFFDCDGRLYRPAQDGKLYYGQGIVIQQVTRDETGRLAFHEVCRLSFPAADQPLRMHTLNSYKGMTVVDMAACQHPHFARVAVQLKKHFCVIKR